MSGLLPMAMFGLEVPAGEIAVPAAAFPASFRITMAAIDPTEEVEEGEPKLATLKIIRQPLGDDDEDSDDDDFDADEMDRILGGGEDDEDDSDEELVNGGPSDPDKMEKAKLIAKLQRIAAEEEDMDVDDEDEDDEDEVPNGVNGLSAKARGKLRAAEDDEDSEDEESEYEGEIEEFVICTLDPTKSFQQPLDITFGEREQVFFKVSGGYSIHLTGNYVEPADDEDDFFDPEDDEDDEYDLEPGADELDDFDSEEEEDDLDDMEDPRITEVDDEVEAPALIKAKVVKESKKRAAPEEEAETLDEMIAVEKSNANGEKLSKKQLKKLKKNDGSAAAVETENGSASKSDKKVSFAKELEQGPTPTKGKEDKKAALGVKVVQGVTIDDKKLGTGPAAKSGDRVGMRYIGKLQDGKVFDSNKKGKPFSFKLGSGEVIKGWDIGIAGMSVGAERRITVPANLAYGSKGAPPAIPKNATLIFDVKLMEINKGK